MALASMRGYLKRNKIIIRKPITSQNENQDLVERYYEITLFLKLS